MTYRELVRKPRAAGFEFDRSAAGSHEIWYSAHTHLRTAVPNHPGDIPTGTLRAVIRQTGLTQKHFAAL
jgi:predicted RNA binding protein YcfA (HicA-like mRNA interferase family)